MRNILAFDIRKNIYVSFIVPNFDYCAQTWHFYCNKVSAKKPEKVNERAVRFFLETNTLHMKNLLKLLGRRNLFLEVSGAQDRRPILTRS